ncbi:MAG: RNA polymerase sigma-70 factor [Tannerellaceae bacterium]
MNKQEELSELQKGNIKVFEKIFKDYYLLLCYEARSYIVDKQIIEELVGDVYRWLWENKETLTITISIRAYLVKAIHNACLGYLRKRHQDLVELDDDTEYNTLFSLNESPLDYVLSKELIERITKSVNELPPQYRKVFELSRLGDMTYNEIAQEMGISINAVKLYQKKALSKLRFELKDYICATI